MLNIPNSVPEMDSLNYSVLTDVKDMAAGMTKEEILETFTLDWDKLSKDEKIYFTEFYNYGRGMAKKLAVSNLLEATKGKTGIPAALTYLRQFADEFDGVDAVGTGKGEFSLKVVVPEVK